VWHGQTKVEDYDAYAEFLKAKAIPDYKQTEGFVKLTFLRRIVGDIAHFTLVTYWENLEVIQNFAGVESELAKYYPEDKDYLLKFEEKVTHYEVFAE
ncbi:MAG: antibiotic biosynthesis monooxygenase, partial [Bacteroidota bacterium]